MATRAGRFRVLGLFTLVAGLSQTLWLNFAPILTSIEKRYGVSELEASALVIVFPLAYVVLSIHAGRTIDRRGYRATVAVAGLVQAAFACLRVADGHFATLLIAQLGIAVAQPYILNGISKLVADWFEPAHGAVATGIGTVGMFLGMALAMGLTPVLDEALGLRATMAVFGAVSAAAGAAFAALARERGAAEADAAVPLRDLLRRDLVLLFLLSFLGLGFFNGLTTWLEALLAPNGIDAVQAGTVGAVLIVGGIVGAGVVPAISDKVRRRKPFVLGCAVAALVLLYPLCTTRSQPRALAFGGLLGFFFLPAYALLLEMTSELAGAASAGFATGILMMMGNAGGVVVAVSMAVLKGDGPSTTSSVALLFATLVACVVLALLVRETFHTRPRLE